MHVERATRMIELLKDVPLEAFDLRDWISSPAAGCGTTCCAIGWAALDPWFQDQGLSITVENFKIFRLYTIKTLKAFDRWTKTNYCYSAKTPRFEGEIHFRAAAKLLDITEKQAEWLFSVDFYEDRGPVKPVDVIKRIEQLLAEYAAIQPS